MQVRITNDVEPDTVVEEWQKGYMLGNRVIRHSKVIVSKQKKMKKTLLKKIILKFN